MAEWAGLDRKTIYRIEPAQYGTRVDHLALIASALGAEIVALFSWFVVNSDYQAVAVTW